MGNKRRQMFNPKFKHSCPKRWEIGQSLKAAKALCNSEIIENLKEANFIEKEADIVSIETISEEMVTEVEQILRQPEIPTYKAFDLKKKKKADLMQIAETLNCSVTIKNTKAEIIQAIEKQSS